MLARRVAYIVTLARLGCLWQPDVGPGRRYHMQSRNASVDFAGKGTCAVPFTQTRRVGLVVIVSKTGLTKVTFSEQDYEYRVPPIDERPMSWNRTL